MNDKDVMAELKDNLELSQLHFEGELNKLRTGRAHPTMVEDVMIEAYGVKTPLKQLATITTPEPQLIQISPFDPSTMNDIAQSIRANESLGLNPVDDGRIVRIQVPPLTTERRQQIVKQLGEKQEDANISIRKARQDAMNTIDKAKKDKTISEDDAKRMQSDVESAISDAKKSVEELAKNKESDILSL